MDTIEAVGKHDFNASSPDELSFRKGDYLQIIDMETDPNWYRATMEGNTGYIPNNYIEIVLRDWLMPDVTRQMAEKMLLSKSNNQYINSDGAFLVRRGRLEGEHSLSVKYLNEVQHFKIYKQNDGYFIWDSEKFPTLSLLVKHYKTASVSKSHHIILQDMVKEKRVRARASYDFTGRGNDELSFRKGDILNITDRQDSDWWTAQIGNGPSGLIPATYVELL